MGQKKNPSDIVAAAGWMAGLFVDLRNLVAEKGGTDEDIHRLVAPVGRPTLDAMAQLIVDAGKPVAAPEPKPQPLLQLLDTVSIPATTEKFVVVDHFKVGTSFKKLKISYVDGDFVSWFGGKTEDPHGATELRRHQLLRDEVDKPIIAELGGEGKVESAVSAIYALMEKQGKGEDGQLLTNSYANIFYVRDTSGVMRAVGVRWGADGWYVGADSVEGPRGWGAGAQVFSSNS
jgi:hypothetical protein